MRFTPCHPSTVLAQTALAAAVVSAVPVTAFAVDYMSAAQAAKAMFAEADRFEEREIVLDAGAMRRFEEQAGMRVRSARWKLMLAMRGDETLGVVIVDEVIGKFELITYAVGVRRDGSIQQIEILSYRESHGGEVRLPAWRQQFVGKGPAAALDVGSDISNISGATLSTRHVTDGVRRAVRLVAMLRKEGAVFGGR